MPELPDVEVYIECLRRRIHDTELTGIRLGSPFVLRSVTPPVDELSGRRVVRCLRLGKRIVIVLEEGLAVVIHLMIAGRFQWKDSTEAALPKRRGLAAFDFSSGTLILTEAGSKRRASIHLVHEADLGAHDPGGLDVLTSGLETFAEVLTRSRQTAKRALTDPRILSGIGNAYSDEILHRARLSPFKLTDRLDGAEMENLHAATIAVLTEWTERLRSEVGEGFPTKVTAFRPQMAVHGRAGEQCPDCTSPVQRIRYADSEANYCARCQTGGRLLADRALSRLLKKDWPRTLDELEATRRR